MIRIKNILFPTDFSELAEFACKYAVSFAEQYGATVHYLHVVDEAYQYWLAMGPETIPLASATEEIVSNAKKQLDALLGEPVSRRCPAIGEVIVGKPSSEIVRYAREKEIDLIVMATHGRGGISHMLLGSTTEKVVRNAPCPVLTIRHPEHEFINSA
jgi:nucleotide-binding universal stress UspA family protein